MEVLAAFVCSCIIDITGRKCLIITGCVFGGLTMGVMTILIITLEDFPFYLCEIGTVTYIISHGIAMGPVSIVLLTDMLPDVGFVLTSVAF